MWYDKGAENFMLSYPAWGRPFSKPQPARRRQDGVLCTPNNT